MQVSARFGAQYAYVPEIKLYRAPSRQPTMLEIVYAVAAAFGVDGHEIMSNRRHKRVALARHVAFFLARKLTYLSFPQIGKVMHRDHTAVLHACKKMEKLLRSNSDIRFLVASAQRNLGITA